MKWAQRIDQYRVFPRVYLTSFFIAYVWLVAESWQWYTSLPLATIETGTLAVITAFPVGLISALGGMFTSMYKHYQAGGTNWNGHE